MHSRSVLTMNPRTIYSIAGAVVSITVTLIIILNITKYNRYTMNTNQTMNSEDIVCYNIYVYGCG